MKNFWSYKKEYNKLREKILLSIDKALKSGNIFFGKELKKFENNFNKYNKSKFGLAVGSGTEALYIAMKSFNIGPGDEVITVSNTAIPTQLYPGSNSSTLSEKPRFKIDSTCCFILIFVVMVFFVSAEKESGN